METCLKKTIKFIIMIFVVSYVAAFVPTRKLNKSEILLIGLSSGSIFAIMDSYAPSYNVIVKDDKAEII